jgi:hypothetical protein
MTARKGGKFMCGKFNYSVKAAAQRRQVDEAAGRARVAKKAALRAAGGLAQLKLSTPAVKILSPFERVRIRGLKACGHEVAEVSAITGRSVTTVRRAIASEQRKLRALMLEDPGATNYELTYRFVDTCGILVSENTVQRERARFSAEDASVKVRATNRYGHFTMALLDQHIGFIAGLKEAYGGLFWPFVYQVRS